MPVLSMWLPLVESLGLRSAALMCWRLARAPRACPIDPKSMVASCPLCARRLAELLARR